VNSQCSNSYWWVSVTTNICSLQISSLRFTFFTFCSKQEKEKDVSAMCLKRPPGIFNYYFTQGMHYRVLTVWKWLMIALSCSFYVFFLHVRAVEELSITLPPFSSFESLSDVFQDSVCCLSGYNSFFLPSVFYLWMHDKPSAAFDAVACVFMSKYSPDITYDVFVG